MKKIISVFAVAALVSVAASAQGFDKGESKDGNNDAWREKVRAEQVAFITSELDLTESEAQKFWPVYNEVQAQRRDAYKESFEAMKELEESIQNQQEPDKKLDKYVSARKKIAEIENDSVKKYSKVLPKQKVAKLLLSEERFRHNQIGKLGREGRPGGHGQMRPPGQRPDGQRPQGGRPKGQRPTKKSLPVEQ